MWYLYKRMEFYNRCRKNIIGKYTGNIYRAIKTKSTALGFLWIFKQDYNSDKIY